MPESSILESEITVLARLMVQSAYRCGLGLMYMDQVADDCHAFFDEDLVTAAYREAQRKVFPELEEVALLGVIPKIPSEQEERLKFEPIAKV